MCNSVKKNKGLLLHLSIAKVIDRGTHLGKYDVVNSTSGPSKWHLTCHLKWVCSVFSKVFLVDHPLKALHVHAKLLFMRNCLMTLM